MMKDAISYLVGHVNDNKLAHVAARVIEIAQALK
jgi:hypothetical protein